MNPEITTLLLPVGKYILATALMVLFYLVFYRGKTSYDLSRKYLVTIALGAVLLSQFQIVVGNPPVQVVKVEPALVVPNQNPEALHNTQLQASTHGGGEAQATVGLLQPKTGTTDTTLKAKWTAWFTLPRLLLLIYGVVTLTLLLSLVFQYFKIIFLKRKGVVRQANGFEIVESPDIPTPFSFCKTIFIGPNLAGKKLDVVIKHEQWHIRHRHYIDVLLMETLVRLLWFNPLLWWVRRELRNISEFQADRSVLDEGHELYQYQTVILEEVMEQSPYLANSFNHSFTKKRFIMMKNHVPIRLTALRRLLILPFLAGVFSLFCLAEGKPEIRYVMSNPENAENPRKATAVDTVFVPPFVESALVSDSISPTKRGYYQPAVDPAAANMSEAALDQQIQDVSKKLGLAIGNLNQLSKTTDPATKNRLWKSFLEAMEVKTNGISHLEEQSEWLVANYSQEDVKRSLSNYTEAKRKIDALPKLKTKEEKGMGLSQAMMSVLEDGLVTRVITNAMESLSKQMQGALSQMTPVLSQFTTKQKNGQYAVDVVDQNETAAAMDRDDQLLREAYRTRADQLPVSFIPYSEDAKLVRIRNVNQETLVTLALPVPSDDAWIRLDKAFTVIDRKTQDHYVVRRVEKGLPLDKIIRVFGCAQRMVEVTLVFPLLRKTVDWVDIVEFISEGSVVPRNSGKAFEIRNVRVRDYLVKAPANVYR